MCCYYSVIIIVHVLWFQTLDSFRQHLPNLSPKSSRHFQNSQHPCNSFWQIFPPPFKFLTYSVLHPATCLPQHVSVLDQKQHCSRRSVRYSQCLITARFECLSRPPQDLRLKTQWIRFPSVRLFFLCGQTPAQRPLYRLPVLHISVMAGVFAVPPKDSKRLPSELGSGGSRFVPGTGHFSDQRR